MAHSVDADFVAVQAALMGEYSLDREIGRGGMGIVYLAREVRLARPVAIKVLPLGAAQREDLREAFLAESRTAAQLNHPNIVPVYAAGEAGGFAYIVMAYVDGVTLGERLRTRGPLLPGQAARVLREVAWALAYAHGAGFVHRDVSAENIMLERGTERAVVMDFGIASAMQTSAIGRDGHVVGNPHYVSPEHIAGEPLDARSDLYSLGVVGFYALTGRLPFDGETSADVITQHLTGQAPAITSVASSVPPRLAAAVERCLHKLPLRRYRNAESFAEAIDLAFEHAREIPAPLRSWINQGQVELPARMAFLGMGTIVGLMFALSWQRSSLFIYPFVAMAGLSYVPWLQRLRRVLGDGFTTDDLHASLREHQLVKAEELEYERRQLSPWTARLMRLLVGVSGPVAVAGTLWLYRLYRMLDGVYGSYVYKKGMHPPAGWWDAMRTSADAITQQMDTMLMLVVLPSVTVLTIAGVPLAGQFFRHRLQNKLTAASISFWKSKWGKRLAGVAMLGRKAVERPMLGMPVLTEVALGRATDNLFAALPKAQRKQLAELPALVRQLEESATKLRESISAMDDQLAIFDRGGTSAADIDRAATEAELRASRNETAARLGATVSALEGIRLDLLRLQMGTAGIDSVTASLEAAQRVGDQIAFAASAHAALEQLLGARPSQTEELAQAIDQLSEPGVDDDADTPVQGVAAASV